MQTSEVRLHSAFLAELLNPNGSHGLEDKFLESFLSEVVNKEDFRFENSSAKVHVEYDIGRISDDGESGGRIDLLLKDKKGNAIVIENKIYAGDQNNHLLRYNNYAKQKFKVGNYVILYLTLDGYTPSEESTGEDEFDFKCISYKEHILSWLEHCVELSARHPLIRETIQQYIINLKDILNMMEKENMDELFQELEDNHEAAFAIIEHGEDYKRHIYEKYVKQDLKDKAKEQNLNFEDYNLFGSRGFRGFYFYKDGWKDASIYMLNEGKGYYWGIGLRSCKKFESEKKGKLKLFNEEPTPWNPYGWNRLEKYKDWDVKTYSAMMNEGEYTKYIIEKVGEILEEIEDEHNPLPMP